MSAICRAMLAATNAGDLPPPCVVERPADDHLEPVFGNGTKRERFLRELAHRVQAVRRDSSTLRDRQYGRRVNGRRPGDEHPALDPGAPSASSR